MLHPIRTHGLHHLRQERGGGICIHINAGTGGRPVKHGEASILEVTISLSDRLGRLVAAKPVLSTTTDEDNFQKVACVYESLHLLACEICG